MKRNGLGFTAGVVAGAIGAAMIAQHHRDRRRATVRLRKGSQVIETARGPIECAVAGEGPGVLFSHGSLCGYDQGVALLRPIRDDDFKIVAVSRAGYLRTPLATGCTPEAQADAYTALLDTLGIDRVAIIGLSGGGPPALQFALRHPDRCRSLVLICAATQRLVLVPDELAPLYRTILRSRQFDFLMWLLTASLTHGLSLLMTLKRQVLNAALADSKWLKIAKDTIRTLFPASLRSTGTTNDIEQMAELPVYPLEQIAAPTLILHGTTDSVVPFDHALFAARMIPGAELVAIERADHAVFLTHADQVWPTVESFLKAHLSPL